MNEIMNEIFIISLMSFVFVSFLLGFQVQMIENRGIFITWQSKEPLKEVQILYSPSGKNYYKVAIKRYSFPRENIKDTFIWVFEPVDFKILNKIKEKAKIKIIYVTGEGGRLSKELFLRGLNISSKFSGGIRDIEYEVKSGRFINFYLPDEDPGVQWRTFHYDFGRSGYYPYVLTPPFEKIWERKSLWNEYTMNSFSAGNGYIYMSDGGYELWFVDAEGGGIMYKKYLTSNVWVTMLKDSLLFVGTSFDLTFSNPTLYCINIRTLDTLWARFFYTVEFPFVYDDSLLVVANLQGEIAAFRIKDGSIKWKVQYPGHGDMVSMDEKGDIYSIGDDKSPHVVILDKQTGNEKWRFEYDYYTGSIIYVDSLNFYFWIWASGARDTLIAFEKKMKEIIWKIPAQTIGGNLIYDNKNITYHALPLCAFPCNDTLIKIKKTNKSEKWRIVDEISHIIGPGFILSGNYILYPNFRAIDYFTGRLIERMWNQVGHYAFPIAYKDKIYFASGKNLLAYEGRFKGKKPINSPLIFPLVSFNKIYLDLNLGGERGILKVYDRLGRLKEVLLEGILPSFYIWDIGDLSSGIYFLILKTEKNIIKKKVIILKGG